MGECEQHRVLRRPAYEPIRMSSELLHNDGPGEKLYCLLSFVRTYQRLRGNY